ncbi:MAG: hypothetical protein BroJett031_23090 [Betaproteobacteria bacterium]|nr:MAG: hypothetical protein BroJett031_23090 [Betaproteobacteria bacterium]
MIHLVAWAELSEQAKAEVRSLRVSERQVEYAGSIESSLAQCEGSTNELVGLAIVYGQAVVGFLLLKCGSKAPQWSSPHSVVISALRIGEQYQGRGYGRQALLALPRWVEQYWPAMRTVSLSVDEENEAAIRSYLRAGWKDQGVRVQGRIGWVRYMSLHLAATGPNPSIERTAVGKPPAAAHVER